MKKKILIIVSNANVIGLTPVRQNTPTRQPLNLLPLLLMNCSITFCGQI